MKKYLFIASLCTFITSTSNAQTSDEEAEAVLKLIGVQKKEAVGKLVAVTEKDSAAFWKLYDEYQQKNIDIGKARIQLYEKTADAYNNMTPKAADSLAQRYFEGRINQERALEEYYKKIKAATNAVVAFQFYQAEIYLQTLIRAYIMQEVPTYGEIQLNLDKKE